LSGTGTGTGTGRRASGRVERAERANSRTRSSKRDNRTKGKKQGSKVPLLGTTKVTLRHVLVQHTTIRGLTPSVTSDPLGLDSPNFHFFFTYTQHTRTRIHILNLALSLAPSAYLGSMQIHGCMLFYHHHQYTVAVVSTVDMR
jgi:hypothetical protein